MLTVRQALSIGGLSRSRVVAGRSGLDHPVTCVDVMEVPDIQAWLRPNEIIVTCGYAIKDDPDAQANLIRNLVKINAAALAVKPARFLGKMPEIMMKTAEEVGLPLIEVPADVAYLDITLPLYSAILNEQTCELQYAAEVHRKLAQAALESKDLAPVLKALSDILHRDCFAFGPEMRLVASSENSKPEEERSIMRFPVASGNILLGYLGVAVGSTGLTSLEMRAVNEAIIVIALQMTRLKAIEETERRLRRELLRELLRSGGDLEGVGDKARVLGLDLSRPYVAVAGDFQESKGFSMAGLLGRPVTLVEEDGVVVGLVNVDEDSVFTENPLCAVEDCLTRMSGAEGVPSLGMSDVHDGPDFTMQAVKEAKRALELGIVVFGPGRATRYKDVAAYEIIAGADPETKRELCERELGPLLDAKDAVLVKTLKVFLESGGEVNEASKKLFVHRNTLNYRLEKIEGILKCDVRDPNVMFRLRMAMVAGLFSGMLAVGR